MRGLQDALGLGREREQRLLLHQRALQPHPIPRRAEARDEREWHPSELNPAEHEQHPRVGARLVVPLDPVGLRRAGGGAERASAVPRVPSDENSDVTSGGTTVACFEGVVAHLECGDNARGGADGDGVGECGESHDN